MPAKCDRQTRVAELMESGVGDDVIGTFSSGRIHDVAIDPRNRSIWYVASASGGLWKTTNRGLTFSPIFDDGPYSLGCIAIDPRNPDTL